MIYQAACMDQFQIERNVYCLEVQQAGGTKVMVNDQVRSAYAKLKEQSSNSMRSTELLDFLF